MAIQINKPDHQTREEKQGFGTWMKIKVKLFATLRPYLGDVPSGIPVEMDVPTGLTIGALTEQLKLPPEEVKICFVNGCIVELDQVLTEADEIGIFPPIGGG
jgi:molybdopterin converting factor small subunit